jgi:hypothetical protein
MTYCDAGARKLLIRLRLHPLAQRRGALLIQMISGCPRHDKGAKLRRKGRMPRLVDLAHHFRISISVSASGARIIASWPVASSR